MFWQFLIEYQAVFASILTLIVTLFATHILRNMGKINFTFSSVQFNIQYRNSYGEIIEVERITDKTIEDLHGAVLRFELILYNKSETLKSLSNFQIECITKSNNIKLPIRYMLMSKPNENTTITYGYELKLVNLIPKNMSYYILESYLSTDYINKEEYFIYLICKNNNGRAIRKKISPHPFIIFK